MPTMVLIAAVLAGIVIYSLDPSTFLSPFLTFAGINYEHVLTTPNSNQTITLGALLPLTGASSSLGESEEAALNIAVKDVNQFF